MPDPQDPFRKAYRELTEAEKQHVVRVKDQATILLDLLFLDGEGRDQRSMAIARTKLEEAVMWATKAITA